MPDSLPERPPTGRFGAHLRAARTGWHYAGLLESFVRMSPAASDRTFVEVVPAAPTRDAIDAMSTRCPGGLHYAWWEKDDPNDLLCACRPLDRYRVTNRANMPAGYRVYVVDDNGDEVTRG